MSALDIWMTGVSMRIRVSGRVPCADGSSNAR
jgi:hypothetical protein